MDYTALEGPELLQAVGTDAAKWAAAFKQTATKLGYSDMDEGWLIGWFANAMMAMYDLHVRGGQPINGDHAQYIADQFKTARDLQ